MSSLLSNVAVSRGSLLAEGSVLISALNQASLAGPYRTYVVEDDGGGSLNFSRGFGELNFRSEWTEVLRLGEDGPQNQGSGSNDTVPGAPNIQFSVAIGGSVNGRTNSAGDDDYYAVELVAGQSYVFTLSGRGGDPLQDPYLELRNGDGFLISVNDDSGPGYYSELRFTATVSGTYYLNARAYEPGSPGSTTGDYTLSAAIGAPQNPLDTIDYNWTVPTTTIEVYFATTGQTFAGDTAVRNWTQAEINAVFAALATYSAVAPLTFVQTANQANAEFTLMLATLDPGVLGYFIPPSGIGAFSPSTTSWQAVGSLSSGGSAFATLVHEFGHALGLAHPHDEGGVRDGNGDGSSEIMQGVTNPFGMLGTFGLNQGVFTTMSYNDGWQQAPWGATGSLAFGSQGGPMALDIALIQQRYGVNNNTNTGNNTYTLTGVNGAFLAIWDAGGNDTISYTGTAAANIDLRAATLQNAIGGGGYVSYVNNVYQGFTIAAGTVIENAIGSAGSDTLIGNDADNILTGGANSDSLNGGLGSDTASYAGSNAAVVINLHANTASGGHAQGDTLVSIENVSGSAFGDTFVSGAAANRFDGAAGSDTVSYANSNQGVIIDLGSGASWDGVVNDILISIENAIGSAFGDVFISTSAANTFAGGAGSDTISYAGASGGVIVNMQAGLTWDGVVNDVISSIENIIGGLGNDQLWGDAGDNLINGGAGGADILAGFGGFDTVSYSLSATSVIIDMGSSLTWDGVHNDPLYSFHGAIGSSFNDDIRGTGGVDWIDGGAGQDIYLGNDDADTFVFRAGEANGDTVLDFSGQGAVFGDNFLFVGYGTTAQGATFVQIDATHWQINSADGTIHDIITIANAASIHSTDFIFGGP